MSDAKMRDKGILMQAAGVAVLLLSTRGFFVLKGTALYFPGIAVGIIIFAVCLHKGGLLFRKSREK